PRPPAAAAPEAPPPWGCGRCCPYRRRQSSRYRLSSQKSCTDSITRRAPRVKGRNAAKSGAPGRSGSVAFTVCGSGVLFPAADKGPVDGAHGGLELLAVHADDDVQFAGALVDHAHVDAGRIEGAEQLRRRAARAHHALAHGGDEGETGGDLDVVRLTKLV